MSPHHPDRTIDVRRSVPIGQVGQLEVGRARSRRDARRPARGLTRSLDFLGEFRRETMRKVRGSSINPGHAPSVRCRTAGPLRAPVRRVRGRRHARLGAARQREDRAAALVDRRSEPRRPRGLGLGPARRAGSPALLALGARTAPRGRRIGRRPYATRSITAIRRFWPRPEADRPARRARSAGPAGHRRPP